MTAPARTSSRSHSSGPSGRRWSRPTLAIALAGTILCVGGANAGGKGPLTLHRLTPGIVTIGWDSEPRAQVYRLYRSGRLVSTAGPRARKARFHADKGRQVFRVEAVTRAGRRIGLRLRLLESPSDPSLGNVWVDADGGSCKWHATSSPYDTSEACETLAAAHRVAHAGNVVRVMGGVYDDERLTLDKGSPRIVFAPGPGGAPQLRTVTVESGSGWIELRKLRMDSFQVGPTGSGPGEHPPPPAHDLIFRDIDANVFIVNHAHRVAILGGDFGPAHHRKPTIAVSNPWDRYAPTDILVEGAFFHDVTMDPGGEHVECILVYAGERVAIRGNRFRNCGGTGDVAVLFLRLPGARPRLTDISVIGNRFGHDGSAYYNVQADTCIPGLVLRDNVLPKGSYLIPC